MLMKMGALEGCVYVFAFNSITSSSSQIEDNDERRRKLVMSKWAISIVSFWMDVKKILKGA